MPRQPVRRTRRFQRSLLPCLALAVLAACGGNPTGPTPTGPTPSVTGVSPSTGTTLGGTSVTISGSNFGAGAVVAIGGTPATAITVLSATRITATTPQHAAGLADVSVSVAGRIGALRGAFTFAAPQQVTNTSPVIQAIKAQGTRKNEPAGFADVGEQIDVSADVTDKETPADQLKFEWSSDVGTFSGDGRTVKWKAPASGPTPLTATITLTVVETYQGTDDAGLPVSKENRVTDTMKVKVHDSIQEVGDMANEFLVNFSKSSVPVNTVMKDFTPTCQGAADERAEVEYNRATYTITSWDVQPPKVTVNFDAGCSTVHGLKPGDACSNSAVEWKSEKDDGTKQDVVGTDQIAAEYLSGRWWLCSSDFDGRDTLTGERFLGWAPGPK